MDDSKTVQPNLSTFLNKHSQLVSETASIPKTIAQVVPSEKTPAPALGKKRFGAIAKKVSRLPGERLYFVIK